MTLVERIPLLRAGSHLLHLAGLATHFRAARLTVERMLGGAHILSLLVRLQVAT